MGSIQGTEVTLATASAFTPDGVTKVKVGFSFFGVSCTNAGETWEMRIKDSVAGQIGAIRVINVNASSTEQGGQFETVYTPSAASHTLTVVMVRIAGTGTGTLAASANAPATLIIQQLF